MADISRSISNDQTVIALIDCDPEVRSLLEKCDFNNRKLAFFKTSQDIAIQWKKQKSLNVVAIISQSEVILSFINIITKSCIRQSSNQPEMIRLFKRFNSHQVFGFTAIIRHNDIPKKTVNLVK